MFFHQRASEHATLSYLFGCMGHGMAAAIDVVAGDETWFADEAVRRGVRITHVIDTHVHADHYSGGRELARLAGAHYGLHESNLGRCNFEFTPLHHGQILSLGNVQLTVLHTPGHTLDSLCLLVSDLRRLATPWFVLTGDTLLVGAVGRPDLAGQEQAMAATLYDSLHAQVLCLPDALEIYPGHQAGSACGVGLSGKPSSTLGFERLSNPLLSLGKANFVAALTDQLQAQPTNMADMLRANLAAAPANHMLASA